MLNEVTLDIIETNRAGLLTIDLVEMLCNETPTSGDRLLPSQQSGVAHVGYLPGERILGLSKLSRLVEHFAARPQTQERLTRQVVDCLAARLRPRGAGAVLEAEHTCMMLRGVRARGSTTVTSTLLGTLRTDANSRAEFLALVDLR